MMNVLGSNKIDQLRISAGSGWTGRTLHGDQLLFGGGNHHSEMLFHAVLLRCPSQPFESPISWLIAIYISDAYTHPLYHLTASNCPFLLRFHFPVTTHFFSLTPPAFPPGSLYASRDTCTCTGSLAGGTIITITGSDLMGKNQAGTFICWTQIF